MKVANRVALCGVVAAVAVVEGFAPASTNNHLQKVVSSSSSSSSELFFFGGGSASKEDLDEQVCLLRVACRYML